MSPSKTSTIAFSVVVAAASVAILTATPAQSQLGVKNSVALQGATPGVSQSGHVHVSGTVKAGNFVGSGAGLHSISGDNVSSGIVSSEFLPNAVAMEDEGNLFTHPNTFSALTNFTSGARFSGFTGVNRPGGPINGNESFGIGNNATDWDGMYVKTAAAGKPYYGYASGSTTAFHYFDSSNDQWKLGIGSQYPLQVGLNGIGINVSPNPFAALTLNRPVIYQSSTNSEDAIDITVSGSGARGIEAISWGGTNGVGILGRVGTPGGTGVYGDNSGFSDGIGVWGSGWGSTSTGVFGEGGSFGVKGDSTSGYGVYGESSTSHGVLGLSTSADAVVGRTFGVNRAGVHGYTDVANAQGGFFWSAATTGTGVGVIGQTGSANGYGVQSFGRFSATGTKAFRIDHPLEPENKYLAHYCSEGPDPLNVYTGIIETDANGYYTIILPDYFDAINRDPRVQLTVKDTTDDFVMVKVVSEIENNRFRIRTSKGGVKVYWEVKGIRNDRYIQEYGAPVEINKTATEVGKYQHPELYGAPESMSVLSRPDRSMYQQKSQPIPARPAKPVMPQNLQTAARTKK